jgi:phosphatidylglycerophosphate synthase
VTDTAQTSEASRELPLAKEGFWSGYWKTLKSREIEEPIDIWVHRPLAYVLAKALYPTPISPNLVTLFSIACGGISLAYLLSSGPYSMPLAGLFLFLSAIFDCADGQLARMRRTSSAFGRMLDGSADLIVTTLVVSGCLWWIFQRYRHDPIALAVLVPMALFACPTTSFHMAMYDHYKNVFLSFTSPARPDYEDYETALERFRDKTRSDPSYSKITWPVYLFYLRSQRDYVKSFDPFTSARLNSFPPFSAERAEIYRRTNGPVLHIWRSLCGPGSLAFCLALAFAFRVPEYYMAFRALGLNLLYYGYLKGRQQRASREAFQEMGIVMPDQVRA